MTKRTLPRAVPALLCTALLTTGSALVAAPAGANDGVSRPAANYSTAATPQGPIAAAPPMGFNNWSRAQCTPQAPLDGSPRINYSFQQYMEDNAKALADTGLIAAGYKTVTVDDCWMYRNSSGYLHGALNWGGLTDVRDTTKQPGFDYELSGYGAYLHSLGANFGIYETSGTHTCSTTTPTSPNQANGSEYHEQADANSFVSWGVDELKYDNCGQQEPAQTLESRMAGDLATAVTNANNGGTPTPNVMFNISAPAGYGNGATKFSAMEWVRPLGQLWRVGPDIFNDYDNGATDPWNQPLGVQSGYNFGAYQSVDNTLELSRYQGPGTWNDADMLLIGDNGMTTAEERSQMSLFSAMAAPLVISTDARKFEPAYLAAHPSEAAHLQNSIAILGNSEVIAVDQDSLGAGGYRVSGGGANADGTPAASSGIDVVVKPLADGGKAVVVTNKGASTASYNLSLSALGFNGSGSYTVRDLWAHATSASTGTVALTIGSHDSAMLRITPPSGATSTPRGQLTVSRNTWSKASLCLDNYQSRTSSTAVDVYNCTGGSNQQWQLNADGSVQLLQTGTSGLCLTAQSGTGAGVINGQQGRWVGVAACGSAPGLQSWTYNRDGNLKLAGTGLCLDVYSGTTTTPGTPVDLYSCGAAPDAIQTNQTWAAPFNAPPGA
ncbi:ricin-type beta-trefoil lectin domain protein [Kitasatospora sp. NPDC002227]|uniref:ricin-type beta-trefoil lectin domain protein n=1 Tax=Kitasatospora sp. NPDC002227 TaxID=3154773 RepID=UPI003322E5BA